MAVTCDLKTERRLLGRKEEGWGAVKQKAHEGQQEWGGTTGASYAWKTTSECKALLINLKGKHKQKRETLSGARANKRCGVQLAKQTNSHEEDRMEGCRRKEMHTI